MEITTKVGVALIIMCLVLGAFAGGLTAIIMTKDIEGETGPQGLSGIDGEDGVDGTNGLNGVNGTDGKDGNRGPKGPRGSQGPAGEDCEENLPPTIDIFYCGDGITSHGEVSDDGSGCDCGADWELMIWELMIEVTDPEQDMMVINVYNCSINKPNNWKLYKHIVSDGGMYIITDHIHCGMKWAIEVDDGSNLVIVEPCIEDC